MSDTRLVPVFPLTLAVCPGEPVPLHIFEPRYKEMIARCRREAAEGRDGEFVIVLSEEDRWRRVGSRMRVAKILNEYEDGRLDLIAMGLPRCEIEEADSVAAYPIGRARPYDDVESDWDDQLANRVFMMHRRLIALVTGREPAALDYAGLSSLSFHVMPTAGLPLARKQELLEMKSENERLRALAEHLSSAVETLLAAHEIVNTLKTALAARDLARGK